MENPNRELIYKSFGFYFIITALGWLFTVTIGTILAFFLIEGSNAEMPRRISTLVVFIASFFVWKAISKLVFKGFDFEKYDILLIAIPFVLQMAVSIICTFFYYETNYEIFMSIIWRSSPSMYSIIMIIYEEVELAPLSFAPFIMLFSLSPVLATFWGMKKRNVIQGKT